MCQASLCQRVVLWQDAALVVWEIAVDASNVYWASYVDWTDYSAGNVQKVEAIQSDATYVYWGVYSAQTGGAVMRVAK